MPSLKVFFLNTIFVSECGTQPERWHHYHDVYLENIHFFQAKSWLDVGPTLIPTTHPCIVYIACSVSRPSNPMSFLTVSPSLSTLHPATSIFLQADTQSSSFLRSRCPNHLHLQRLTKSTTALNTQKIVQIHIEPFILQPHFKHGTRLNSLNVDKICNFEAESHQTKKPTADIFAHSHFHALMKLEHAVCQFIHYADYRSIQIWQALFKTSTNSWKSFNSRVASEAKLQNNF